MRIKVRIGRARHAFTAPIPETPACSNYEVLERWDMLRNEAKGVKKTGASAAILLDTEGKLSIVYGRISVVALNSKGSYQHFDMITREGDKYRAGVEYITTI